MKKFLDFPLKKCLPLVLPRKGIWLEHLIIQFMCYYLSSGHLREVKNKINVKHLVLHVVTVTYERWSLTKGSKYSDLTRKLLAFWKTGHWGEVVAAGDSTVLYSAQASKM